MAHMPRRTPAQAGGIPVPSPADFGVCAAGGPGPMDDVFSDIVFSPPVDTDDSLYDSAQQHRGTFVAVPRRCCGGGWTGGRQDCALWLRGRGYWCHAGGLPQSLEFGAWGWGGGGALSWAAVRLGDGWQQTRPVGAKKRRRPLVSFKCLPPCVTFRRVVAPLRGPGRSSVLPFACCVGSLLSVGRCGRCSRWCRFRVRGAQ